MKFTEFCNHMFKKEVSGYRFVDLQIVQITDENEMKEIEKAIKESAKTKLSGVHTHLKSALGKLSDRKNPDYRNSIKESISAVESMSKIISAQKKQLLGVLLKFWKIR